MYIERECSNSSSSSSSSSIVIIIMILSFYQGVFASGGPGPKELE